MSNESRISLILGLGKESWTVILVTSQTSKHHGLVLFSLWPLLKGMISVNLKTQLLHLWANLLIAI